ncbi:hypothetical protein TorRG33x02_054980 [Trema orientale]|uniref:Uncharacterized protein n=1 Tax=Trema orientale TaxID=63057 RepID=A0A2P5FLC3_TREOI|nr:hypothetical protein TorRG33x02_054980 [Trema orientale]
MNLSNTGKFREMFLIYLNRQRLRSSLTECHENLILECARIGYPWCIRRASWAVSQFSPFSGLPDGDPSLGEAG